MHLSVVFCSFLQTYTVHKAQLGNQLKFQFLSADGQGGGRRGKGGGGRGGEGGEAIYLAACIAQRSKRSTDTKIAAQHTQGLEKYGGPGISRFGEIWIGPGNS